MGYVGELSGYAGRGGVLPFWMGRDRWGAMPDRAGGVLRLGLFSDFREGRKIQTAYGFSGVGISGCRWMSCTRVPVGGDCVWISG